MNISNNNKNYIQADYKQIEEKIADTLPIEDEEIDSESIMSDEERQLLVGYMGYQSKVDQVDIYLRGSTNNEVGYNGALSGVLTFNDMQNRMRISDVYA